MKIMRFGAGIALILFIGVLGTLFVSCPKLGDDSGKVTGVNVTPKAETVVEKQSVQLTATVSGEGTYDETVTWESKAPQIATVDDAGKVTGKAPGTVKITATSKGDNTISGEATITVEAAPTSVSKVEITADVTEVKVRGTITLEAKVTGGSGKGVAWSSSNSDTASVDENGVVTGNKPGSVTITAKSKEDENILDRVEITVLVLPPPVSKVEITDGVREVLVRGTITLEAKVTGGEGKGVTWSSSNSDTASVDENGVVTGNKPGSVTITAKSKEDENILDRVEITVLVLPPPVSKVEITDGVREVLVRGTITLEAEVTGGEGKGVAWSSSNSDTASVDENGVVTGNKPGSVTITAKSKEDENILDRVEITVLPSPVSKVEITADVTKIEILDTITLEAKVTGGQGKGVTWSSGDTEIASVDQEGKVTGKKLGSVTITAKSKEDEEKFDEVTITVVRFITAFSIKDPERKAILPGQTFQFELDVTGGSGLGATWSTDSTVHKIDKDSGLLTAGKVEGGSVFTITATSKENPEFTDTIERFAVLEEAPSITIKEFNVSAEFQTPYLVPGVTIILQGEVSSVYVTSDITWSYEYDKDKLDSDWVTFFEPRPRQFFINHLIYSGLTESVPITVTASSDEYPESKATFTVFLIPDRSGTIRGVTITPGAPTIVEKESVQLKATVTGDGNLIDQAVTWESGNPNIATVDKYTGMVTGVAPGTVKIIATSKRNANASGEATITVEATPSVSNVKITSDVTEVGVRDTITLKAEVEGGEDKGVSWSSSNPEIASVNQYGVVTGIKIGSVTITAKSKEDASKSASVEITVRIGGRLTVSVQRTTQLVATDGDTPKVTWSSSDPYTATVDENGVVKGLKPGEVEITAKYVEDGTTLSYKVTVNVVSPIIAFSIKDPERKAILRGQTFQFELDVTGGAGLGATWSIDSAVHKIDKDSGLLTTGASDGNYFTITATSKENPEFTDTIEKFYVMDTAPSLTIAKSGGVPLDTVQLKPGANIQLYGRVNGDALSSDLTWSYEYDGTKLDNKWIALISQENVNTFTAAHLPSSELKENVPVTLTATLDDYPESKATGTIIFVPASSSE